MEPGKGSDAKDSVGPRIASGRSGELWREAAVAGGRGVAGPGGRRQGLEGVVPGGEKGKNRKRR